MPLDPSLPSSAQQKLQQLREQIDDALQALVTDMLALSAAERETAVSEARTAAQQEKDTALESVRAECEAAVAERIAAQQPRPPGEQALAERLEAAEAESAAARAQAAAVAAERDHALEMLAASKAEAEEKIAAARAEADARVTDARAEAAAARASSEQALADAKTEADARVADAQATAAARAADEQARAEQALADARTEAEARLDEARVAADARVAEVRAEADRQLAEGAAQAADQIGEARAAAAADLEQARVGERECDLACVERLVDGLRALDAASSLSATLEALADHVAAHVARVALFVVRGENLRVWTTAGFGEEIVQAPSIDVRLDGATVIAHAAQAGERATTANGTSETPLEPLAFAPLPPDRTGLAVPLRVGGRTVAVLYADEGQSGDRVVPSAWPEIVEILARHAGLRLELHTLTGAYALHAHRRAAAAEKDQAVGATAGAIAVAPRTGDAEPPENTAAAGPFSTGALATQAHEEDASAIRYARLLISEIKLYHEDAVVEGREEGDLLNRLGPEITRARRLYEERVPAEVRNRADHFGQELIRTLANGNPRLLGQVT